MLHNARVLSSAAAAVAFLPLASTFQVAPSLLLHGAIRSGRSAVQRPISRSEARSAPKMVAVSIEASMFIKRELHASI